MKRSSVSSEIDLDSEHKIRRDEILTDPKSLTILSWTELAGRRLLLVRQRKRDRDQFAFDSFRYQRDSSI